MPSKCDSRHWKASDYRIFLFFQRIPALRFQGQFISVTGNECAAQLRFGDMADDSYVLDLRNLLMVGERNGKQQFVIFSAV